MTTLSSLYGKGLVSDVAYPTGWNGETNIAPSKNTVYDEMELRAPKASPTFTGLITASDGQIAFPATQNASAGVNTLDDYEEGTWTPDLQFGGAKVGITYSAQGGFYTKIGRQIMATCYIILSSKGTSVGDVKIYGLPFTIKNSTGAYCATTFRFTNVSFANVFQGLGIINDTVIWVGEITEAGTRTFLTDSNFANNSAVGLQATYIV